MMPEEPRKDEELIDEAIGVVSEKLMHVNHSTHIVALSQELRALIEERKKLGSNK
jgi:hypothetical protein